MVKEHDKLSLTMTITMTMTMTMANIARRNLGIPRCPDFWNDFGFFIKKPENVVIAKLAGKLT